MGFPCIEVEAQDIIDDWQYDLNGLRQHIPNVVFPARLDLKAIRHNLFHFNDRLRRIYCDECDAGVDCQEEGEYMTEEDASIPEEVRAEILNEVDRQVPKLLAKALSSILMQFKK